MGSVAHLREHSTCNRKGHGLDARLGLANLFSVQTVVLLRAPSIFLKELGPDEGDRMPAGPRLDPQLKS